MSRGYLFFAYYLPVFAWMGLIFWLSSIPNLELQGGLAVYDLALRKLAHLAEYAVLAWLLLRAALCDGVAGGAKELRKAKILAVFLAVAYAISDEVHQWLVPTRDGKMMDVLIDSVGVFLGLKLYYYRISRFGRNRGKGVC